MNSDSEAEDIVSWLLQQLDQSTAAPSGEAGLETGRDALDAAHPQSNHDNLLDSEQLNTLLNYLTESDIFSFQDTPLSHSGEIPAVQDRFYALLRHRLREEIERRPPLYPWETEVREYEDALAPELATATVWASQMQALNLPVPMPEGVLNRLFEQCQSLLQSSLQEGRKLVQAVESLFPGESAALNHLAGYVMAAPARSGASAPVLEGVPDHYDAATQPQQMLLSLVAAREILNTLVLTVSPAQPVLEREWHTTAGLLTLRAMLLESGSLRLVAQLPCAGRLKLQSSEVEKSAHRANAGPVSLELLEVEALQSYSVQVELEQAGTKSLSFAIAIGE
ncbi:hypothetical protein [Leptolyngbya sp. O-77]|uniref:hypothetical protein n=1 Tax=Leptolyngbya sp. O-77 TaxID=1080068 RepID=UPI00074D2F9C|nr:hypothetical protein [Leptolyngbya sp. O-77]BAU44298.1 hypothetical protein O77CONTIG1_04137 [Leptolyngbya sp. O-77]